jgi:hypothetical protein
MAQQRPANGGFTGPDASNHSYKTLALLNPVEEMV